MSSTRRRAPLPPRERSICQRVRRVRENYRLTQTEFADQLQVTRARIGSYEESRAPLRWELALRLCEQFIVSEKWLATGVGSDNQLMSLRGDPICRHLAPGALFSEGFDSILARRYEELRAEWGADVRLELREDVPVAWARNIFLHSTGVWVDRLPPESVAALYAFLVNRGNFFTNFVAANGRGPMPADEISAYVQGSDSHAVKAGAPSLRSAKKRSASPSAKR